MGTRLVKTCKGRTWRQAVHQSKSMMLRNGDKGMSHLIWYRSIETFVLLGAVCWPKRCSSASDFCDQVFCFGFTRISSSFYREAVENVAAYNLQLMRERMSRLPYVDAQTGIAQSDCHLLRSRMERRRGNLPGQVYSYPPRRWRRERKSTEPRKVTGV